MTLNRKYNTSPSSCLWHSHGKLPSLQREGTSRRTTNEQVDSDSSGGLWAYNDLQGLKWKTSMNQCFGLSLKSFIRIHAPVQIRSKQNPLSNLFLNIFPLSIVRSLKRLCGILTNFGSRLKSLNNQIISISNRVSIRIVIDWSRIEFQLVGSKWKSNNVLVHIYTTRFDTNLGSQSNLRVVINFQSYDIPLREEFDLIISRGGEDVKPSSSPRSV
jgi:hypothetical protein